MLVTPLYPFQGLTKFSTLETCLSDDIFEFHMIWEKGREKPGASKIRRVLIPISQLFSLCIVFLKCFWWNMIFSEGFETVHEVGYCSFVRPSSFVSAFKPYFIVRFAPVGRITLSIGQSAGQWLLNWIGFPVYLQRKK